MKKRFRTVILCLCAVLAVSLFGCNKPDDNPPGPDPAGPTIPVAENFDFSAALADSEGWHYERQSGARFRKPLYDLPGKVQCRRRL